MNLPPRLSDEEIDERIDAEFEFFQQTDDGFTYHRCVRRHGYATNECRLMVQVIEDYWDDGTNPDYIEWLGNIKSMYWSPPPDDHEIPPGDIFCVPAKELASV